MIRKSMFALVAAFSLAACGGTGTVASTGPAPADTSAPAASSPLTSTQIDDKVLILSFEALGVAASAADMLLHTGAIKAGSPVALSLADKLQGAYMWLDLASSAQQAGQAMDYAGYIEQASAAISGIQADIAKVKGN